MRRGRQMRPPLICCLLRVCLSLIPPDGGKILVLRDVSDQVYCDCTCFWTNCSLLSPRSTPISNLELYIRPITLRQPVRPRKLPFGITGVQTDPIPKPVPHPNANKP